MKVVRVSTSEQDYYIVFSIFVVILTVIAILLSVAIPVILKKRPLPSKLVCTDISAEDNSQLLIYNKDTPLFGKYYIDPATLKLTLFRPSASFLYKNGYLYGPDRSRVLTLRRIPDFLFVSSFTLSFEPIQPYDTEDFMQRWLLAGGIISTSDLRYKLTVTDRLKIVPVFYGANKETSCNWVFEKL